MYLFVYWLVLGMEPGALSAVSQRFTTQSQTGALDSALVIFPIAGTSALHRDWVHLAHSSQLTASGSAVHGQLEPRQEHHGGRAWRGKAA